MPHSHDWLPNKRSEIIIMAKKWCEVIPLHPEWGVPTDAMNKLLTLTTNGADILEKAISVERTMIITAQCREAFTFLVEHMRFIKSHHLLSPPLTNADLVSLLIFTGGGGHSMIPIAILGATGDVLILRDGRIAIKHIRAAQADDAGHQDERSEERTEILLGVLDANNKQYRLDAEPLTGLDLFYTIKETSRKTETINLLGESGKIGFICMRFVCKHGKGPFGPIIRFVIP